MHSEIKIKLKHPYNENGDIAASYLNDIGLETVQEDEKLSAYITLDTFDKKTVNQCLIALKSKNIIQDDVAFHTIEKTNWNALWESNFEPIIIKNCCYIKADFHQETELNIPTITINPKMSFGTGHHATTHLALEMLNTQNLKNMRIADIGTGTGILAIFSIIKKAKYVLAIDNDAWSVANAIENVDKNKVSDNIDLLLGDAHFIKDEALFDLIVANINRNILLNDMPAYAEKIKRGGTLIISGFYKEDISDIIEKATSLGLYKLDEQTMNNWACIKFNKA